MCSLLGILSLPLILPLLASPPIIKKEKQQQQLTLLLAYGRSGPQLSMCDLISSSERRHELSSTTMSILLEREWVNGGFVFRNLSQISKLMSGACRVQAPWQPESLLSATAWVCRSRVQKVSWEECLHGPLRPRRLLGTEVPSIKPLESCWGWWLGGRRGFGTRRQPSSSPVSPASNPCLSACALMRLSLMLR